jgi:choline dehydrogenase
MPIECYDHVWLTLDGRNIDRINPALDREVHKTVDQILSGHDTNWAAVNIYSKILQIVAIVSGSVFLGPDLCRRPEWVHSSINYTIDLFTGIAKIQQWHPWLRPFGQYSAFKSAEEHRRKAREFLRPVIAKRRQMDGKELPDDMLQWMLNKCEDFGLSDEDMASLQLDLSLVAIHTTTGALVFM